MWHQRCSRKSPFIEPSTKMRIVILAAGYATRLHPLTLTRPKPLLPVSGRPIIDYLIENLSAIDNISHVYLVTNDKFTGHFQEWADGCRESTPDFSFKIINDGSTGAVINLNQPVVDMRCEDDGVWQLRIDPPPVDHTGQQVLGP